MKKFKLTLLSLAAFTSVSTNAQINVNAVPFVDQAKIWGFAGDGGPAINAEITIPSSAGYDALGNYYFSDMNNYRIRKVNVANTISTIAGSSTSASTGDGSLASSANFLNPSYSDVDNSNNVYIVDDYSRIRKIDYTTGNINTIAGTGVSGYSGDGGLATAAQVAVFGITHDASGNIYFLDGSNRIRKIDASTGIITTIAGNGTSGSSGDGGPAIAAQISARNISIDNSGNILINQVGVIRKVNVSTGIITTIAGTGVYGNSGDGGSAITAQIGTNAMVCDASGNIYIGGQDPVSYQAIVRKIDNTGNISTAFRIVDAAGLPFHEFLNKLQIKPSSGNLIAMFDIVCAVDLSIYELVPATPPAPEPVFVFGIKHNYNICPGGRIFMNANGSGTYAWTGPNGFTSSEKNPVITNASTNNTGVYSVVLTTSSGQVYNASTNISIKGTDMTVAPFTNGPICEGEIMTLNPNTTFNNYEWVSPDGKTLSRASNLILNTTTAQQSGKYTLNVVDNQGCIHKGDVTIVIKSTPHADFTFSKDAAYSNPTVQFNDASSNAQLTEWKWNFGDDNNTSGSQNPTHTYQDAGKFNVALKVISDNGCENAISKMIVVEDDSEVMVPNAFSPNGDNQNDIFIPTLVNNHISKYEMEIFNRNGKSVFYSNEKNKGWDGYYKNQIAEVGVYAYKLTYVTNKGVSKIVTGSVTLLK